MDWDAVSAMAEVIGVLVVIASLIYIAIQIRQNSALLRQNSELARAAMVHETNVAAAQLHVLIAQSDEVASIFQRGKAGDHLNDTDTVRFIALVEVYLTWLEDVDSQYKAGLYFDEEDDTDLVEYMAPEFSKMLRPHIVREWWAAGARFQYAPSFMEKIERIMSADWSDGSA